jgi:hypothetical protein
MMNLIKKDSATRYRCLGLVPVVLLLGARHANAAGKCEGQWHFELARPNPEAEEWIPKGSFCGAAKLPRSIDVTLRYRAGGGVEMSGTPYKPADVMTAGGQCEFVFEGKASGLPEDNGLHIEVTDGGKAIRGTAKCSHAEPRAADGTRSGTSIEIAVSGTHGSAAPATPSTGPEATVASVLRACRQRAGDDLWNLMTPRFRAEVDGRAASVRQSMPAADLRKLYDYRGPGDGFTGLVYLRQVVKGRHATENPCADAAGWKVGETGDVGGGTTTVVHRPDGTAFGLKFAKDNQTWRLDQITKAVARPAN